MLSIQPYNVNHLQDIDDIWNKFYKDEFTLPNLRNNITNAVALRGDKVIAFGMVKMFAEAIMVLDKNAPLRDKVQANDLLLSKAFEDSRDNGLEQVHVVVADNTYGDLLKNKYTFRDVTRRIMVKDL